jgi:hypothetical protein
MEYPQDQAETQYLRAIPYIMMGLMQKSLQSSALTAIDIPARWPTDSAAVKFFQASLSAKTIGFLQAVSY